MPPLNHTTDLQRDGSVYVVTASDKNAESYPNDTYERDRNLCVTLSAALLAAEDPHEEPPRLSVTATGLILLDEPHEEGETYLRTSIQERPTYTD